MRIAGLAVLAGVVCAFAMSAEARAENYGFGTFMRRSVTVERRLAPEYQLANVSVDVVFPRGTGGLDGQRFTSELETLLVRGGQNISLQNHDPQYEIRLSVISFDRPRVDRQTQKNNTTYTAVGSATMTYQLVHRVDGQAIIAGTESYDVRQAPASTGAPARKVFGLPVNLNGTANQGTTDDSVALRLYDGLAGLVASHMVVTAEAVQMPLARGPGLDDADKLAEAKRWNEYLETLTNMTPAATPGDDAYRLYDIGVANEALGYASDDPKVTLKFLGEASVNYTRAMEARGTEKVFTDCQQRIEKALARYTTLEERNKQATQMQVADAKHAHDTAARKKAGAIDNDDIIKLVRARVDPRVILLKIRTAPMADFDLSTDGLVQLSQSGVGADLITEMTHRMDAAGSTTRAPGTAPAQR